MRGRPRPPPDGRGRVRGVRFVGLAWARPTAAAAAPDDDGVGGGRRLLDEMARLHVVPDPSHLNLRALLTCSPTTRASRRESRNVHALRPIAPDGPLTVAGWSKVSSASSSSPLLGRGEIRSTPVAHIDHMVGLVGPTTWVSAATDGGFHGTAPQGDRSVADLARIGDRLHDKGCLRRRHRQDPRRQLVVPAAPRAPGLSDQEPNKTGSQAAPREQRQDNPPSRGGSARSAWLWREAPKTRPPWAGARLGQSPTRRVTAPVIVDGSSPSLRRPPRPSGADLGAARQAC